MFSQEEVNAALKMYHQCGSVTKTIRIMGYPTRRALYWWIENEGKEKPPRKEMNTTNTEGHPRNPSVDLKMDAIRRCFELGESVKSVSEDIGYSRASIYQWRKKYLRGGSIALMNDKNIQPEKMKEGSQKISPDMEIRQLQKQVNELQMEIDILHVRQKHRFHGADVINFLRHFQKRLTQNATYSIILPRLLNCLHLSSIIS